MKEKKKTFKPCLRLLTSERERTRGSLALRKKRRRITRSKKDEEEEYFAFLAIFQAHFQSKCGF